MDFKDKQNLPAIFSSDPAAIAAAETAKARIQAAYIMALQKPRNEDQARIRILEACKRPMFAERVEFSKPVSGRKIKGPSVRFAELALREWGNVDTETQVIYEDDKIRRIKIRVLDLETNAGFSKEIQITKTVERKSKRDREVVGERTNTKGEKVYIVKATDDELENKQNALISKAVRNEGLRLVPSDITDEAIETAKATMRNKFAEDPKAAKKKILDSFSEIGLKPTDIEQYLKHSMDTVSPIELQDLRGIYRAIRDGEATWASYIEEKETKKPPSTEPGTEGAAQKLYGNGKQPPKDNQDTPGAPEEENKGDDTPEGEKGAGSVEIGHEFANLTGMMLSKFAGLHDKGVNEFIAEHKVAIPTWPPRIRKIIHDKLDKKPEWAKLLEVKEKEPEKVEPEHTGPGYVFCPTGGKFPGKQISPMVVCSGCDKKDDCEEYQLYLESQKDGSSEQF